jgi:hypothetical protein
MSKTDRVRGTKESERRAKGLGGVHRRLLKKWEGQFQFEGRGDVESILEGERCRGLLDYIEWGEYEANREWMKRYYNTEEIRVRLINYTEHYSKYFTQYAFNFRLAGVGRCMEKRKRKLGKLLERKLEAEMGSHLGDKKTEKDLEGGEDSFEAEDIQHQSRELEIRKWQKRFDKVGWCLRDSLSFLSFRCFVFQNLGNYIFIFS